MKSIQEKFIKKIDELIEKAKSIKDYSGFFEWKTSSENLINLICGQESEFYKNFVKYVVNLYPSQIKCGVGILKALKDSLEQGYIKNIKDLVIAEVFTDFLDMAEHLLENGYKDAAASLIGAVLENGLRKIAEKHNVTVKTDDNINSLNTKLADKGIYNRLIQKQIQAWKDIRDAAAHGKFNEYNADQVKLMLEGVRKFLAEYL
jgi:hypothetical protein